MLDVADEEAAGGVAKDRQLELDQARAAALDESERVTAERARLHQRFFAAWLAKTKETA